MSPSGIIHNSADKVKAFLDAGDMEGLRRWAEEELKKLNSPRN